MQASPDIIRPKTPEDVATILAWFKEDGRIFVRSTDAPINVEWDLVTTVPLDFAHYHYRRASDYVPAPRYAWIVPYPSGVLYGVEDYRRTIEERNKSQEATGENFPEPIQMMERNRFCSPWRYDGVGGVYRTADGTMIVDNGMHSKAIEELVREHNRIFGTDATCTLVQTRKGAEDSAALPTQDEPKQYRNLDPLIDVFQEGDEYWGCAPGESEWRWHPVQLWFDRKPKDVGCAHIAFRRPLHR